MMTDNNLVFIEVAIHAIPLIFCDLELGHHHTTTIQLLCVLWFYMYFCIQYKMKIS